MAWNIRITDEAKKDYEKIEGSIRRQVLAGIIKVSKAPLPSPNGYGKPLGNKNGNNLTGFFKIKYRGIGIRVVYTLVVDKITMNIMVISQRDDNYCYDLVAKLYEKYGETVFKDIFGAFLFAVGRTRRCFEHQMVLFFMCFGKVFRSGSRDFLSFLWEYGKLSSV